MDIATAQSHLVHLLQHLPKGWWWKVYQKEDEDGIAKACRTRRCCINALLCNAGICKMNNSNQLTFKKNKWQGFTDTPSFQELINNGILHVGTFHNQQYVAYGKQLQYQTPGDQISDQQRNITTTTLPEYMDEKIRSSLDHMKLKYKRR